MNSHFTTAHAAYMRACAERQKRARKMAAAGKSVADIARELGVSRQRISYMLLHQGKK
jgi:DNA-binding CsgD family transcriptional regulator